MVKSLATSPHDPLGITDSACKNQLVVVSVQYGPFNPYIPIRSTTIGKSRVAIDPIAMHTSWRSNSDIASVTRSVARKWKEDDELALTSAEEIWNLSNGHIRTEAPKKKKISPAGRKSACGRKSAVDGGRVKRRRSWNQQLRVKFVTEAEGTIRCRFDLRGCCWQLRVKLVTEAEGTIRCRFDLRVSDSKTKVKKQQVRTNHVECHQKFQARIHEAEDSMQAQHLLIEALVYEKDSLLQTIHGLQEANNAPAPFDGEWEEEPEEEPEEEEIGDIPLGEGEIDDE
ncbi:hypothetical protein F511_28393 [Dorcoceras hygrometricum]|uniref:Uncharacterized protein n=1 Tax=Dorcoceras hygrometricum TaxID=472368 RepID=A0A2Z7CBK2_9LAMI|nr:hypothetical protein F511_28393 [Dorcoceras hygrometricum]